LHSKKNKSKNIIGEVQYLHLSSSAPIYWKFYQSLSLFDLVSKLLLVNVKIYINTNYHSSISNQRASYPMTKSQLDTQKLSQFKHNCLHTRCNLTFFSEDMAKDDLFWPIF